MYVARAISESEPLSPRFVWSLVLGECILQHHSGASTLADVGIADGTTLTLIKNRSAQVLTASGDKTARIWSTSTGDCVQTFSGHEQYVNSVVFSADGSSVLTASGDKTAKIWSIACKPYLVMRTLLLLHGFSRWIVGVNGLGRQYSQDLEHLHWRLRANLIWS